MASACVASITDAEFAKEVLQEQKAVLIDFYTQWCQPCKAMSPILDQICTEFQDTLKIVKIDAETNMQTARQHQVGSVPMFVLYRNGRIISQTGGLQSKTRFAEWIRNSLSQNA